MSVRVCHQVPNIHTAMIKLTFPLPKAVTVALSGGVDSVAVTDFLSRRHDVSCAFFHHGTENSERAYKFVAEFCTERSIPLFMGVMTAIKPKEKSQEEHWRDQRYEFLESLNLPIVTAHNLDDCVETYLHSSLNGQAKVIPNQRNNILRPFLTTPKAEFLSWCTRKELAWCEDLSNTDTRYTRNYIRHQLLPHALQVNPGLATVVRKIVERQELPL
jgi:tRNA(Ile)-lysidine synthase